MKQKRIWTLSPTIWLLTGTLLLFTAVTWFWNWRIFLSALVVSLVVIGAVLGRSLLLKRDVRRYLKEVALRLDQHDRKSLESMPMPIAMISQSGELVWYNVHFQNQVLKGKDGYGQSVEAIFADFSMSSLNRRQPLDVTCFSCSFSMFVNDLLINDEQFYILYCIEDTSLKEIAKEYTDSRPVVLSLYIDNSEEVMQTLRDSERANLSSRVETLLEDWISHNNGIFRKSGTDRFTAVIEHRYLSDMLETKFDILDRVRTVQTVKGDSLTLSVGVGTGVTFLAAERHSRLALDMALGRGGDQAAVKTENGFDFYGGLSKAVERQTRVRSRVVASALRDMILNSDMVLLMGHRYSDLDCLGAAAALTTACRSLGKMAYTVYDPVTTLAGELVSRFAKEQVFITADEALPLLTTKTLVIITDTHVPSMLDIPELYEKAGSVVVIDHHRKMVDHIGNAMLFFHEPYSSSASEMVTELIQYMDGVSIGKTEAEGLLAGIMLDTRSFVMKAGVRTFEAAAYLKKIGADTVEVKRLFSENITLHQRKAEIVSTAEWYKSVAIAYGETGGTEMRVAASQAADELLCVKNATASFTMFPENGGVNLSARSYGAVNVQLIMEALGGGGHRTMAGAFLKGVDIAEAQRLLKQAIDAQL